MARAVYLGVRPPPPEKRTVRRLGRPDLPAFRALAAASGLPGLQRHRDARDLGGCVVFGAFADGDLVGTACVDRDARKRYVGPDGICWFPVPNVHFYGAFVRADYRGRHLGTQLYEHRLAFALERFNDPIVVELLGDGKPSSVHRDTRAGYAFYLAHGFRDIGYSLDPDGGKIVLLKRSGSPHRCLDTCSGRA